MHPHSIKSFLPPFDFTHQKRYQALAFLVQLKTAQAREWGYLIISIRAIQ